MEAVTKTHYLITATLQTGLHTAQSSSILFHSPDRPVKRATTIPDPCRGAAPALAATSCGAVRPAVPQPVQHILWTIVTTSYRTEARISEHFKTSSSEHLSVNLVPIYTLPDLYIVPSSRAYCLVNHDLFTHQLNRCNRSTHESHHVHPIVRYITTFFIYCVLLFLYILTAYKK